MNFTPRGAGLRLQVPGHTLPPPQLDSLGFGSQEEPDFPWGPADTESLPSGLTPQAPTCSRVRPAQGGLQSRGQLRGPLLRMTWGYPYVR